MPVVKPHIHNTGLHFITFTCYKWIPLIDLTNGYDLFYKWFDHLQLKGHAICAYVIMPNHVHLLAAFSNSTQSINTIVGNGKRFIAYSIVKRLVESGHTDILEQLRSGVSLSDKIKGSKHCVFEPSFDIKECYSLKFINQKLDYIHNNPVSKKWSLVRDAVRYVHSSASFYISNMQGIYPVRNVTEFIDMREENSAS